MTSHLTTLEALVLAANTGTDVTFDGAQAKLLLELVDAARESDGVRAQVMFEPDAQYDCRLTIAVRKLIR